MGGSTAKEYRRRGPSHMTVMQNMMEAAHGFPFYRTHHFSFIPVQSHRCIPGIPQTSLARMLLLRH